MASTASAFGLFSKNQVKPPRRISMCEVLWDFTFMTTSVISSNCRLSTANVCSRSATRLQTSPAALERKRCTNDVA